ncbi:hypothetical protein Trydic_g16465 [Trypoxylus dichotomus]
MDTSEQSKWCDDAEINLEDDSASLRKINLVTRNKQSDNEIATVQALIREREESIRHWNPQIQDIRRSIEEEKRRSRNGKNI